MCVCVCVYAWMCVCVCAYMCVCACVFSRHVMPEFLPNPNALYRDRIKESLERMDMYNRRANIDIPEFYVGEYFCIFCHYECHICILWHISVHLDGCLFCPPFVVKAFTLDITCNFFNKFFHTCHVCRLNWYFCFCLFVSENGFECLMHRVFLIQK